MKHIQRLSALLLTLVILVGLLAPAAQAAVGNIALPTADCEEVVFDYGKTVSVPIATIQKHITLINSITVSGFVGITLTGSNSQILTAAPSGVYCTNADTDKSVTTAQGTLVRTSTDLQYTPTEFQDQITRVYAVFSLSGSDNAKYILVEVRFIPAAMMYYEAEDFASEINTYDTTDGGATNTAWRTVNDSTGYGNTTQSADYVGETNFSPSYDKKHIAAGAFFSDFDGTGNANRYSLDPVYESVTTGTLGNFDNANYWTGSGSDSVNTDSGLYTMTLAANSTTHFMQTTTNKGNVTSSPLSLRPTHDDIFEIRFKLSDVSCTSTPILNLHIATASSANVNRSKSYTLNTDQVNNGDFITINGKMMDFGNYRAATMVYSIRIELTGMQSISGSKLIVDYIYLGPQEGVLLPITAAENGLYFGFEGGITHTDPKSTKAVASADYSSRSNWYTDGASTLTVGSGVAKLVDKITDQDTKYSYNFLQPAPDGDDGKDITYTCTGDDIFVICFKTTKVGRIVSGNNSKAKIRLEYRTSKSDTIVDAKAPGANFTLEESKSDYIIKTFKLGLDEGTVLKTIRPTFYFVQECTFSIDYFYLVPNDTYTDNNADNKYFIDFTRTMNERVHTTRNAYGHQRLTYYDSDGIWTYNSGYVEEPSISSGCLVIKDANTTSLAGNYRDSIYARLKNLHLDPDKPHYLQIRMRIDPVTSGGKVTKGTGNPNFYLSYYVQGKNDGDKKEGAYNSTSVSINLDDRVSKGWFTINFKIGNNTEFNAAATDPQKWLVDIAPVLAGTQGAKLTIDYIYIGVPVVSNPGTNGNPTADHLYFGFRNNISDKTYDKTTHVYHSNNIYGGYNFDTAGNGGNWATNTEASASAKDYTITNGDLGLLSLNVQANKPAYNIHGPYLFTTNKNGSYGANNKDLVALRYHPQENSVFQIRFRLNGCTVQSGQVPKLVFLFNGYDAANTFKYYGNYTYNERYFVPTEDFQTITIPLSSDFCNMAIITNIGMRFQYIQNGKVDIDYIYIGPISNTDPTYGNDSSYADDAKLSNAKSLLAEGKGVRLDPTQEQLDAGTYTPAKAYTETIFSFKGTGFDIISRTGPAQGAIRVSIYDAPNANTLTIDNLVKSMTVNNKGDRELYQIPVVSVQGLTYGTYYVKIAVNKEVTYGHPALDRGKEFYFDALRIYDPLNVYGSSPSADQVIARVAYNDHNEFFSFIKEIREQLLSVSDFSKVTFDSSTSGAIFVDSTSATDLTVKDYNKIGPKNEVYLAPGQAIAFKLTLDTTTNKPPFSIDIGAKSILGDATTLSAGFVTTVDTSATGLAALSDIKQNISTSTAMYYPLNLRHLNHTANNYLVIYNSYTGDNTTEHILSITDLKICYRNSTNADIPKDDDVTPDASEVVPNDVDLGEKPAMRTPEVAEEYYDTTSFEVDAMTLTAAEVFIESLIETPLDPDPIELDGLRISHSLDLASDISLNYAIPVSALEEYDSFRLEITVPKYEARTFVGFTTQTPEPVEKNGYYYFTVDGLTAVNMMDELEATLYTVKGNQLYYTPTDVYSIATYAFSQLGKEGASPALKTLCADLLLYGSKAQTYKYYRTDTLAEEWMDEKELSNCTDPETVTFGNNNIVLEDLEAPSVVWMGKTLTLESRVGIRYIFDVQNYAGDVSDLTLRLIYVDHSGEEKIVTLTDPTLYREDRAWYSFDYYGLLAAELRTVVDAQVMEGKAPVSCTLRYSPDTYGNNKTGDLGILCRALFAYSDSAKAYFETK
ncbi:MAG: hypothetical protein IKM59_04860 [Oscillospiraceae bacterium]|nr:hypothetical protein [Oscillospiraceae bacterium]